MRLLKKNRETAPILKNKTAWTAINPDKSNEKIFRLFKFCIIKFVVFLLKLIKMNQSTVLKKHIPAMKSSDKRNYIKTPAVMSNLFWIIKYSVHANLFLM